MLTELYVEALLVDEELADQVWELWDAGLVSGVLAVLAAAIARSQSDMLAQAKSPTTSVVSDGLIFGRVLAPGALSPSIKLSKHSVTPFSFVHERQKGRAKRGFALTLRNRMSTVRIGARAELYF